MKLQYCDYTLELLHRFSISKYSRKTTPSVIVRLDHEGFTGYGEASLPQYLKENQESVRKYLGGIYSEKLILPPDFSRIGELVSETGTGNYPAKAALDIAFHDLIGRKAHLPVHRFYGNTDATLPFTSYTIGIDSPEMIRRKIMEADGYRILKVKLGSDADKNIIETIREITDKPIFADANGGWRSKEEALDLIEWLALRNVLLVEEPLAYSRQDDIHWLKNKSPLPIIADESVQSFDDLGMAAELFHGINIKLMKCGGISPAFRMINEARKLGLKIMLGCMTETSCGIAAACQLAHLADWADLDGNLLIANDPFYCETVRDGRIFLSGDKGIGVKLKNDSHLFSGSGTP